MRLFLFFLLSFCGAICSVQARDEVEHGATDLVFTGEESKEAILGLDDAGYKLNAWNRAGDMTIFMAAAAKNSADTVEALIEAGGDFNLKNPNGFTALSYAALSNPDPEVIKVFMKKGADFGITDKMGATLLMLAAGFNKSVPVVQALLDAGAKAGEVTPSGMTALMFAIGNKAPVGIVRSLIAAGENVNHFYKGQSLLFHAFLAKNPPEVIGLLISAGANVHARETEYGRSVLMEAALQGTPETVRLLLERGASPALADAEGNTALFYAVRNKEHGKDIISLLIEHGANVNASNNDKGNPYMLALYLGNLDAAKVLWKAGGNLGQEFLDMGFTTLIWTAAFGAEPSILNSLIHPHTLKERDKLGNTALARVAAFGKNYNVAQILLNAGADVNETNDAGCTPLMLAAKYSENANMVLTLLNADANLYAQDNDGRTAFDYAKDNDNPQILETLKNYANGML